MRYSTHLLRHLRFTIGQNIHRLRARHNLSLPKFAAMTGISEGMLDQYELGKHEIRLNELLKIACALEVGIFELVT